MTDDAVRWPDEADAVINGDLTTAAAYLTPSGGAVVTAVSTMGSRDRDKGRLGFTTSLGFPRKLERILLNPRVALAYHSREHGFADSPSFVLAQGKASVDITPERGRIEALAPEVEPFYGKPKRGPIWDRLLHEYYFERVFVDIVLERVVTWPDLGASGAPEISGAAWPSPPDPQEPPKNGTAPRLDVDGAVGRMSGLPHRVLAYRGADGFPVIVPVELAGHDDAGIRLVAARGLLPPGGRRAGLLAHAYRPQLVGLGTRSFTGWLDVADDGRAIYAPHTTKGFVAPPRKNLLLVSNGLFAKVGMWRARQKGEADRLTKLAASRADQAPEG